MHNHLKLASWRGKNKQKTRPNCLHNHSVFSAKKALLLKCWAPLEKWQWPEPILLFAQRRTGQCPLRHGRWRCWAWGGRTLLDPTRMVEKKLGISTVNSRGWLLSGPPQRREIKPAPGDKAAPPPTQLRGARRRGGEGGRRRMVAMATSQHLKRLKGLFVLKPADGWCSF